MRRLLAFSTAMWYDWIVPKGTLDAVAYGGWPHLLERRWFISLRSYRREVRLMWKKRLFAILRFVVTLAIFLWIVDFLTLTAC